MGKIKQTLLVPRQPQESASHALEITYPFMLMPDDEILLTEARLIDQHGTRATEEETWLRYHPEEWRAATLQEQQEYLLRFGSSPKPWFRTLHRIHRSVFDFPDSGNPETNNGQDWSENLDAEWEAEEQKRDQFRLDEEAWQERVKAELFRRFEKWGEG